MSNSGLPAGTRLFWAVIGLCGAAGLGAGEIAAVTQWIPHAGHHHHSPSIEGYIALYAFFVLISVLLWYLVGCAVAAAAGWVD